VYVDVVNVEHKRYDHASYNWSHRNCNKRLKKNLEAVPGKHLIHSLQQTAVLGTSHTILKVLQYGTWSLSGGDYSWFKRRTGEKKTVTDLKEELIRIWQLKTACIIPLVSSTTATKSHLTITEFVPNLVIIVVITITTTTLIIII
jgi:hypothetical protein